jgi:hypothetical protein
MRAGLSDPSLVKSASIGSQQEIIVPPSMPLSPRPQRNPDSSTPPPLAVKPRPRRSSSVNEVNQFVDQTQRPYTYHEGDSTFISRANQISPPPVAPRLSLTNSNGLRPQSRPISSYFPDPISTELASPNKKNINSASESTAEMPSSNTTPISSLSIGNTQSRPMTPNKESPIHAGNTLSFVSFILIIHCQ